MIPTKKEIEEEIANLSAFIDRKTKSSLQLINSIRSYLERENIIGNLLEKSKPVLKKQKLGLEIIALKTRLEVLKRMIKMKERMECDEEKQNAETKKDGS